MTPYNPTEGGRHSGLRFLTAAQLAEVPALEYAVKGVFQAGSLVLLYGQPGVGKTFAAVDLALSQCTGIDWHGREVRRGSVLYVAAEGASGLSRRVKAWQDFHKLEDLPDAYFLPRPVSLADNVEVSDLIETIQSQLPDGVAAVYFDTLARCMGGADENSTRDMGAIVNNVDRIRRGTNATVVLVHHTGKGGGVERGSSALRAAADTVIQVGADRGNHSLHFKCEKQKEADPFEVVRLKLESCAESCVMVSAAEAVSYGGEQLTANEAAVLTALYTFPDGARNGVLKAAAGISGDPSFNNALKGLKRKGRISERLEGKHKFYMVAEATLHNSNFTTTSLQAESP